MVAAHHGFIDSVKLLANRGADLTAEDKFGQNILWYCLGGTSRHTQISVFCLNEGVPQTMNVLGKPIFVRACEKGNKVVDVVEALIGSGADVKCMARRTERTGLIEACRRGAVKVISLLLKYGASVNAVDVRKVCPEISHKARPVESAIPGGAGKT